MLRPRSLAVVGASPRSRRALTVLSNLRQTGFAGRVYAVNPNHAEVQGVACFPDLAALPEPPDCVVVALARERVLPVLEQCAARGAGGAVVYAAGFGEGDSRDRRFAASLAAFARRGGLPVLGPNCVGFLNYADGAVAYSSPLTRWPRRGPVGCVVQSGSVAIALERLQRQVGYSHLISCGNELVVDAARLVDFLVDDPETRVIACFSEGIRDPAAFARAARRAGEAGKPVVLLKVGRSPAGAAAAVTHTGALAGDWAVQSAVLGRLGVVLVDDLDELVETVCLFARLAGRTPAANPGWVGVSGGELTLILDLASRLGCGFGAPHPRTAAGLAALLPPFAGVGNPLDVTGAGIDDLELTRRALRLMAGDPGFDLLLFNADVIGPSELTDRFADFLLEAATATGRPCAYLSTVAAGAAPELEARLAAAGVPLLLGARAALAALAHLRRWAARRPDRPCSPGTPPPPWRTLDEAQGKAVLRAAGLSVPRGGVAAGCEEAADLADEIGYPVVVKLLAADVPHKSSRGGVRLGLRDRDQVRLACDAIGGSRFLVEEMVSDLHVEVIVGLRHDPDWGPVLLVGHGGVRPGRPVLEPLPVDRQLAADMVARAFDGWLAPALVEALLAVARLAAGGTDSGTGLGGEVVELDVNPLFVTADGSAVTAVDALIVAAARPIPTRRDET